MSERTCSVQGCDRPHAARGLCQTHYSRLRRHGSPGPTIRPRYFIGEPGQEALLAAIRAFWAAHGYAPSGADLRKVFGISSKSTMHYHLHRLKDAGRIAMDPAVARSIRVIGER